MLLVSKIDEIFIFDCNSFKKLGMVPIELLKPNSREPNQIISMQKSEDNNILAVLTGKLLIKKE